MGGEQGQSEVKGEAGLLCFFRFGIHAVHNYHIEPHRAIILLLFYIIYINIRTFKLPEFQSKGVIHCFNNNIFNRPYTSLHHIH